MTCNELEEYLRERDMLIENPWGVDEDLLEPEDLDTYYAEKILEILNRE